MKHTSWYEAKTGNNQGLIISEDTGENIAVSYKKEHARLIAAAPNLLDAIKHTHQWLSEIVELGGVKGDLKYGLHHHAYLLNEAIQKAE